MAAHVPADAPREASETNICSLGTCVDQGFPGNFDSLAFIQLMGARLAGGEQPKFLRMEWQTGRGSLQG